MYFLIEHQKYAPLGGANHLIFNTKQSNSVKRGITAGIVTENNLWVIYSQSEHV